MMLCVCARECGWVTCAHGVGFVHAYVSARTVLIRSVPYCTGAIGVISTGLTVAQSHTDVTAAERIGIVVLGALLAGATIANKIMNPKEEPQKRD